MAQSSRLVPQSPDSFSLSTQFRRAQLGHFSFVVAPNDVISIFVVRSWIDVVFLFVLINSCLIALVGKCSVLRCFALGCDLQERNRNANRGKERFSSTACWVMFLTVSTARLRVLNKLGNRRIL